MNSQRRYLLDANVLIQANNEYYPMRHVPGFWETLVEAGRSGTVGTIDRIRDELRREGDELWDWVRNDFAPAVHTSRDETVVVAYREVMKWVQDNDQYFDEAKREFATVADAWLVAYAVAKSWTVVTQETFAPDIRRAVKIPNACAAFDVECINTFALIRRLNVKWGNR